MFGVLNDSTEPIPIFTNTDTPDVRTNLAEISRWKLACENLLSILFLITSGPAVTLVRQYLDRSSVGGLGNGQQAWNSLYAKYHNDSKEEWRALGHDPDDYVHLQAA